ncbi:MAG: hypothetical protein E7214_01480 [Clostridium sp.]|nr:hypothetical protein [Clostridium sp.]
MDKGLATIGSATENVATNAGKAWVGEGYKSITDNAGNVIGYSSNDGMRVLECSINLEKECGELILQKTTSILMNLET